MRKRFKVVLTVLLSLFLTFAFLSCSNDGPAASADPETEVFVIKQVKNVDVNPEKPYAVINWGLYDNQKTSSKKTNRNGESIELNTNGCYSVYIPEGLDIRSKVVIVLTPDGTSAYDFARTAKGVEWMKYSEMEKTFAVAFVEPLDGKTWNTTLAPVTDAENGSPRDERAFIYDVFQNLSSGSINSEKPYISVDKSCVSLVGYNEGAAMASVLAAGWPALFANTTLVEPTKYEKETIETLLSEGAYPHIIGTTAGYDRCRNEDIGMPLFIYGGSADVKKDLTDKWNAVNDNAKTKIKDTQAEPDLLRVTSLDDAAVEALVEATFTNNRFMGYSGGTVRSRFDFSSPEWEIHEEKIAEDPEDFVRRWYVYTPSTLPIGEKIPLVTVLHGSSASIRDVAEESRWTKIADENGFVVLFVQGKLSTRSLGTSAPISGWSVMNYSDANPDFFYLNAVIDKVIAKGNIDESRLYLTGHSLGGMMTTTVMGYEELAKRFAAFGTVGAFLGPNTKTSFKDTPVYALTGEWESSGAFPSDKQGKHSDGSILSYLKYFGMAEESLTEPPVVEVTHKYSPYDPAKFDTRTYLKDDVPYLMHTVVNDSPHTYMADRARLLWEDFFSHYHRDEEGKAVYTK